MGHISPAAEPPADTVARLVESAASLGIAIDRSEAGRWIAAYRRESDVGDMALPSESRSGGHAAAGPLADYVERLADEAYLCTAVRPDYRRAAGRLYNIFRLTGRYAEADRVRALMATPVAALSYVAAELEMAPLPDVEAEAEAAVAQVDRLIMSAVIALNGSAQTAAVRNLLPLRDAVARRDTRFARWTSQRWQQAKLPDRYLEQELRSLESVRAYLDSLAGADGGTATKDE